MLPKECVRRNNESISDWVERRLWKAYKAARKGKRDTLDEFIFEANAPENIKFLRDDILERTYAPSRGIVFISHRPVVREIFAAPFRDRVVHHFLYDCVADWWDRRLIYDSCSCRKDKGVLMGRKRLRKNMNRAMRRYPGEKIYIVKLDIRGYFMSLPRTELFERIVWGLDWQFQNHGGVFPREYYILKFLWRQVIFDDPTVGVDIRFKQSERKKLAKTKTLFGQPEGIGIVIGNLSSQLLSNIYLDALDRFVTMSLGYNFYARYVDDFYFLVPESGLDQAHKDIEAIRVFLEGLGLTLHPDKQQIQPIDKGVLFLGARIFPNRTLPGPRLINNYRKAVRDFESGNGDIASVISYMGHMTHMKGDRIQKRLFEEVGWDWNFY